jgi:hypothetical protein
VGALIVKGHQQIISARLQGKKPSLVFVEAGLPPVAEETVYDRYENALACGLYATVNIPPEELNARLDLRFMVGLRVVVHGEAVSDAVLALGERIVEAGARHVVISGINDTAIVQFKDQQWEACA